MKKLILSVMVTAFAVAVYADDNKACASKEGSCCAAKAKTSVQAQGECPMAKQTSACCSNAASKSKGIAAKQILKSPKAQAETRG